MTLPIALERFAAQLRDATPRLARRRTGHRRLRLLGVSLAALTVLGSAAIASGWLGGQPAPDSVKHRLTRQVQLITPEVRAKFGVPIASEAIVGASLDSKHFVWGAPTTNGGYCVGVTSPNAVVDGYGCSGASAGMWGLSYDCDGTVIVGGRIDAFLAPYARILELRHDGRTLDVPLDPARHGFFISRLPSAFFRDVQHDRKTWPRIRILDVRRRLLPPARVNRGRAPPPSHPACGALTRSFSEMAS